MAYLSKFRPGLFASGIGLKMAEELASLGASLALVDRQPDKLQVARPCPAQGLLNA